MVVAIVPVIALSKQTTLVYHFFIVLSFLATKCIFNETQYQFTFLGQWGNCSYNLFAKTNNFYSWRSFSIVVRFRAAGNSLNRIRSQDNDPYITQEINFITVIFQSSYISPERAYVPYVTAPSYLITTKLIISYLYKRIGSP